MKPTVVCTRRAGDKGQSVKLVESLLGAGSVAGAQDMISAFTAPKCLPNWDC